jgi:excinuclease ABC subunit C
MLEKLAFIPEKPGIYLFKDEKGRILYVGKAKVLKNRVRSYFQKASGLDERKTAMMKGVADLEYTVTGNELEALILEANLIKQYKPRYNILLRDDKSYPYLKLTLNEKWPRLEVVRRVLRDGARYFGPYVPAGAMWKTLSFIRDNYSIPSCRYSLEKRLRPCIQYQIKKCSAPCSGEIDHAWYMQRIREIELLLSGKNAKLLKELQKKMQKSSEELRYEEAAALRDRIIALQAVSESQNIVSPELGDADVIGLFKGDDVAVFKLLFIRNGIMTGTRDFEQKNIRAEKDSYLFRNFIEQFYSREIFPPSGLFCSRMPEDAAEISEWLTKRRGSAVRIVAPSRGIRRRLVEMAEENAKEVLRGRRYEPEAEVTQEVALLLGMKKAPESIGGFDISNITGQSAVGAFVFWENGQFNKSFYRHIRMDSLKGPDDYAMMREMIRRTFKSAEAGPDKSEAQRPDKPIIPDLIIIDGGREHLNAALAVFGQQNIAAVQVIGLAKDPDRVFLENQDEPLLIEDSRPASLLLRRIRDEAHRFAVTWHRKLRAKKVFESALDSIYGLGRQRRFALLEHFGSIEAIKKASADDIANLKGFTKKLAQKILTDLNTQGKRKEEQL